MAEADNRSMAIGADTWGWLAAGGGGVALAWAWTAWWRRRSGGPAVTLLDGEDTTAPPPRPARDGLTGLQTRASFEDVLDFAFQDAQAAGGSFSVLYIGLDGMRSINELQGHAGGDSVLAATGRRLLALTSEDACARIASDEFGVLVQGDAETARRAARRVVEALALPVAAGTHELKLTASVGVASYPEHGGRQQLLQRAAIAMRSVKLAGGGAFAEYHLKMTESVREKLELARELQRAIQDRQLELVYQPKVDARSLEITAAEALLRWNHPLKGVVSPELFIPVAERHGLIGAIGDWVLDEAIRQAAQWRDKGLRMRVAINVSGFQMRQDDFVERLARGLAEHELRAERFTCEITETLAMEDTAVTQRAFARLGEIGAHVSIDDFGTGHSSLAALRRLPAAELKIDSAFVTDLATSADARTIVQAIVQMAHTLELRVVAEGVETGEQRDQLVALGCDELQGFFFAKPMSAAELELWAIYDEGPVDMQFRDSLFCETAPATLQ
jgi:diguanylate cyclase (GGDEF)-like protein